MNTQRVIALLGRKDEPTDAVEEYCRYLGAALAAHDIQLEIERFPWEKIGWTEAFKGLRKSAATWKGQWVLVHYTALAWSARGFPAKVLRVLTALVAAGARVAVLFHDVEPFPGTRLIDRWKRAAQIHTMHQAVSFAEKVIFTVAPEKLSWLHRVPLNAVFVPVGPNLPIPETNAAPVVCDVPTIGVFSITGGEAGARETKLIVESVREASRTLGRLRLSVFGRHAELRETEIRQGLNDCPVDVSVEGVVGPSQVVERLSACDALLFVRGAISSRRSSAIAGIACGLPVIAFAGSETTVPITDAGVMLIRSDHPEQWSAALIQLLSDDPLRKELALRSKAAYQQHFSWPAIARRVAAILNP